MIGGRKAVAVRCDSGWRVICLVCDHITGVLESEMSAGNWALRHLSTHQPPSSMESGLAEALREQERTS